MRYWNWRAVPVDCTLGVGVACHLNGEDADRRRQALRCLVASWQAQTHGRWKMYVVHDGPTAGAESDAVLRGLENDKRIIVLRTPERMQKHGHPHRQMTIDALAAGCDWLLLTNDDNYYAPTFAEWMLSVGEETKVPFVHCDCVHSHKMWKPMTTEPRYKRLDLGGFIVKSELAKRVPFDNFSFHGDGDWINRLVALAKGRTKHVAATLFVHN